MSLDVTRSFSNNSGDTVNGGARLEEGGGLEAVRGVGGCVFGLGSSRMMRLFESEKWGSSGLCRATREAGIVSHVLDDCP